MSQQASSKMVAESPRPPEQWATAPDGGKRQGGAGVVQPQVHVTSGIRRQPGVAFQHGQDAFGATEEAAESDRSQGSAERWSYHPLPPGLNKRLWLVASDTHNRIVEPATDDGR
jgi:hypothetical protein